MVSRKLVLALMVALLGIASVAQAGGDAARGKELAIDCVDCHGEDGKGDEEVPSIAGMDPAEQVDKLKKYQSGELEDENGDMLTYTEDLSDQDMADLAAYYATLKAD